MMSPISTSTTTSNDDVTIMDACPDQIAPDEIEDEPMMPASTFCDNTKLLPLLGLFWLATILVFVKLFFRDHPLIMVACLMAFNILSPLVVFVVYFLRTREDDDEYARLGQNEDDEIELSERKVKIVVASV